MPHESIGFPGFHFVTSEVETPEYYKRLYHNLFKALGYIPKKLRVTRMVPSNQIMKVEPVT